MTRNGITASAKRLAGVTIAACLIGGCAEQDSSDYCDNHYLLHESHADKIGKLDIAYSEDGFVIAVFSLPHSIFLGEGESSGATIDEIAGILNDSDFRGVPATSTGTGIGIGPNSWAISPSESDGDANHARLTPRAAIRPTTVAGTSQKCCGYRNPE